MDISATEFKAKCLKLIDEVNQTHEPITITKHGKPMVKLVPVVEAAPSLFGCMQGTVEILGDIVSPIDVEWEAMSGDAHPFPTAGHRATDAA